MKRKKSGKRRKKKRKRNTNGHPRKSGKCGHSAKTLKGGDRYGREEEEEASQEERRKKGRMVAFFVKLKQNSEL
jgi:hypothetical protein